MDDEVLRISLTYLKFRLYLSSDLSDNIGAWIFGAQHMQTNYSAPTTARFSNPQMHHFLKVIILSRFVRLSIYLFIHVGV